MMKKLVVRFLMLIFVLGMSTNVAWATHFSPSQGGLTPEQAETYGYWAKLTAKPATTTNGSGKVFVITDYNYEFDPEAGDYLAQSSDEDWSDIYLASNFINADVSFRAYAKSDDGSYFTGWSFTDGYTDLGTTSHSFSVEVTPSATAGRANKREHVVYAAFLPVQLVSNQIVSGSQEVADDGDGNWTCTQNIRFRAETPGYDALSSVDDVRHFKLPVVTKKTGTTGTWSVGVSEWTTSNITFYGPYAELTIPVTFTAPNDDAADYAATLTLETKAGVKMTAYLYARRTIAGAQAIRYNKSKVQQEAGDLTDLLSNAAADDIIKLNGNYSDAVTINKNITFDLNGYTLSNTLTVSNGNVTLAYSPFGGTISSNVSVTGGKLILTGATITGNVNVSEGATLEQNGAAITGTVTNAGTMTTTDGSITGQLASGGALTLNGGTFTNNSGVAVNITGGTADIKRGTISGSTYGVQTTGGSATISKLAAVTGATKALQGNGGSLIVNNGKFSDPAYLFDGAVTFNAGYFRTNNAGGSTALGKQVWRNTAGAEFRDGYVYFVGDQAAAQASNVSVCRIGKTSYNSLEEALGYANNSGEDVIIIMENDYTLKAGYYTIPSNATLIVPMSNDQETANRVVPRETSGTPAPVAFRKLIFESGVNMEVAGTLEVTCTQYGTGETMGIPGGNYGHLILKPGSHVTINNGGYLRAWGFVTGDGTKDAGGNYLSGEIDVRRGGTVHEMFQMGDWKGGDISFTIAMEVPGMTNWRDMAHLFPIYTYFIQNVESPVKYHPGASLICATSVNVAGGINAYANDIKVVGKEGEAAMFLMDEMADAENTWVRKYYDAKKDQQVYEVNSGAKLGSMVIDLGELPGSMLGASGTFPIVLDSRKFVLPLTSNFKIHLLSGYMEFTQSTSCLPGMEVEVDKESEVAITKNDDETIVSGALYFYDADQWSFQNNQTYGYVGNSGKFGAIVRYSATWDLGTNGATKKPNVRSVSSPAAIGDAILNVHGTFRTGEGCAVYTTWAKDNTLMALDESEGATGGASVISSNEDAGTFIFDADAPTFDGIHMSGMNITGFGPNVIVNYDHNDYGITSPIAYPVQIPTAMNQSTPTPVFGIELCTPVKLQNGDGTFVSSDGTLAGTSYCYRDGRWTTMQVAEDECFMKEIVGGQTTYYAKPSEYVAVVATWDGYKMVGNDDHTFSDAAGAGRLFILMEDCQWWEVEKKDNLYHCIHPNNDTYYYWDETEGKWMEQRFTITWLNYDGTEIKSCIQDGSELVEVAYSVTYGTQAEYLGSNPTREPSEDYTYDFAGWNPELGPVKSNVTYTATYTQQPRKYTIIFTEEGGKEIERHFLLHNDMPECENVPTRTGFTLQWEPEIQAVTGDATYRATWLENPPTEYAVTFYDYDGTTKLKPTGEEPYMVAVGAMPTPPAQVNGKPATSEYTYVFDHWSPALEKVSVTSAKSYTAVYREVAKTFPVKFYFESKSAENQIGETQFLEIGQTPAIPDDERLQKAEDNTNVYQLVWTPQIQTVVGHAGDYTYEYVASYTSTPKQYSLTLKCTPSGAAVITGARADYAYGATPTITVTPNAGYNFIGWSDSEPIGEAVAGTYSRTVTINDNIELTVVCECPDCDKSTINWMNENGEDAPLATDLIPIGSATIYHGATPTKEQDDQYAYTFYGWTTRDNDGNILNTYKNGMTPVVAAAEQTYTYYACFTPVVRQYNVSLSSTPAGVCTLVGAGSYDYSESYENATVIVSGYDAVNYTFDGWYMGEDQISTAESYSFAVQSDVELVAKFSPVTYTIMWKSEDGISTLETDDEQSYGAATAFNSVEPTKSGYSFIGWTTAANGEGSFYAKGATPAVSGDAIYYAYFTENAKNLVAEAGETPVTLGSPKDYANFVITSNGVSSGQLMDAQNLSLLGDAIFRLEQSFAAGQWYAVAVPWTVDPNTGIYAGSSHLSSGSQIFIIEFDANIYASADRESGRSDYWKFLDETGHDMQPGKLYMIYLKSAQSSLDFYKKAGASICTTSTSVSTASGSVALQENWNAIANPALYYANMATGAADGDVLKYNGNDAYVVASSTNMVVGQPIFAQVSTSSTVEATPIGGGAGMPAYRRVQAGETNNRFVVELSSNGQLADRLIVQTADEKDNEYVIGQDLSKMGISAKVAQMWINRYDAKLCKNTVALQGEQVEYPLNISAPVAGDYVLSASQERGDATIYLTYNGEAILNLSDGAYVANLSKGTDANYGLRINAKAPQVATGVDEAIVDAKGETKKVIINDKVFIIRGEKVYSIDGRLAK